METQKLTIFSSYRDFKVFLEDFVFDNFDFSVYKPIETNYGFGEFHLHYSFLGSLIDYKIVVVDKNNLEIEISVPKNNNEDSENHVKFALAEIKNNFSPAELPEGFKNLISETKYVEIMQERWRESERTQRAKAYLSTIVLLGSILEGILLYKIKANMEKANRSEFSPKKDGRPKEYSEWTLENMVNVCHNCRWINKDAKSFSDGLKEYRNFVHPWKQFNNNLDMPNENTCKLSREIVEIVLNDLWKNL
ncbi:MAG: hypothetical protein CVU39_22695 [Chloroflexi bacterium HGW-Chloroflexi-10]|nr:MAG: hypothetical protein CVU39_22695 [Chloroflexi bacterium HGW-Chloroflexi-10]